MLDLLDTVMIAGLGLAIGACAFLIWTQLRDAKQTGEQDVLLANIRRGERLDLYMGIVWSGFLLVQVTNIFHHIDPGGTFQLSSLSLAAVAGDLFVCGGFAGRLLLRREMRLINEKRTERNETART
jgi:hypothetical protein